MNQLVVVDTRKRVMEIFQILHTPLHLYILSVTQQKSNQDRKTQVAH